MAEMNYFEKFNQVRGFKNSAEARAWIRNNSEDAKKWFRDQALNMNPNPSDFLRNPKPFTVFRTLNENSIGKMYMFLYDPKWKNILPFWDTFPLIFPLEMYSDGFLAINLHYLPPGARAQLMDALYNTANNDKYDNSMRLTISYGILKEASTYFKNFEQCVKRYLFSHVKSSFHYVNPLDWDKALLLPLQRWQVNPNKAYAKAPPY